MCALRLPKAVLFDMDGTLTQPLLDFALIKREMGIGDVPILEALNGLGAVQRDRALAVLLRHEDNAADQSTLNAGCHELLEWLATKKIGIAIVTRNSRRSTQRVMERHKLPFDVVVTRDDGVFKPDPRPLHLACERLRLSIANAWMVGDGQYDVQAGLAAGAATVWISHGRARDFPQTPWRSVRDLLELHHVLLSCVSDP